MARRLELRGEDLTLTIKPHKMKTRLLIFAFLIIGTTGFGQTLFLKLGPSFSRLSYSNAESDKASIKDFIVGYDAIVGVNYLNFKYFNLSSGIGLIQKGGNVDYSVKAIDEGGSHLQSTTSRLNFLTVNTTFNLGLPIKETIKPYIFAGPRLDYLFSYDETSGFVSSFYHQNKVNKLIYGMLFGLGVNFSIKKIQLGAAADYYLNFNKLVNYTSASSYSGSETTYIITDNTFTINFLVGYKF
jgi:hypothetical protein